jgi:uncharacterized protein
MTEYPAVKNEYELAMFPLGNVLFPFSVLPLRIFEERYRLLTADVLAGSGEFGVVLIERGSEVGGGDVRFAVATVGKVLDARPLDDGGWLLAVVGTRRIEIVEWLQDVPYPKARVRDLDPAVPFEDGEIDDDTELGPDQETHHVVTIAASDETLDEAAIDSMISALRQLLAMRAELNEGAAPATTEFDSYPLARVWQACAVLPVGPLDDLALLRCATTTDRVDLLRQLIDDEAVVLRNRLAGG